MCKEYNGGFTDFASYGMPAEKQELRTMRGGKTRRDHETGAHANRLKNRSARAEASRRMAHTTGKKK